MLFSLRRGKVFSANAVTYGRHHQTLVASATVMSAPSPALMLGQARSGRGWVRTARERGRRVVGLGVRRAPALLCRYDLHAWTTPTFPTRSPSIGSELRCSDTGARERAGVRRPRDARASAYPR